MWSHQAETPPRRQCIIHEKWGEELNPYVAKLLTKGLDGLSGVLVTARAGGEGVDFVSRCFFPNVGLAEDPVTGSAHCALGPYWADKLGKTTLAAYQ
eukprot:1193553-Prorocentrum_minimum.AAC.8